MTEPEKRTQGWPIKWKRKHLGKTEKSSLRSLFLVFFRGVSFFTLSVISTSLFSDSVIPLFLDSPFPSLLSTMPQAPAIPLPHASSPCLPLFPMPQAHASSPAHPQAHASSPCQVPASSPCLKPIPLFPSHLSPPCLKSSPPYFRPYSKVPISPYFTLLTLRFPETDPYFVLHYIISTLFRLIYL